MLGTSLGSVLGASDGDRLGISLTLTASPSMTKSFDVLVLCSVTVDAIKTLGLVLGTSLGATLGESLGVMLGLSDGWVLGTSLGVVLGESLGNALGVSDGERLGTSLMISMIKLLVLVALSTERLLGVLLGASLITMLGTSLGASLATVVIDTSDGAKVIILLTIGWVSFGVGLLVVLAVLYDEMKLGNVLGLSLGQSLRTMVGMSLGILFCESTSSAFKKNPHFEFGAVPPYSSAISPA
jgi:hypothetical protein